MTIALEDLVLQLEDLSGETGLDPDVPIIELPIDSLVLIEWLYEVEDATGISILQVFEEGGDLDELSLSAFHARIIDWAEAIVH